jgi:hypothetical protein
LTILIEKTTNETTVAIVVAGVVKAREEGNKMAIS